jgi:hypothetical protein
VSINLIRLFAGYCPVWGGQRALIKRVLQLRLHRNQFSLLLSVKKDQISHERKCRVAKCLVVCRICLYLLEVGSIASAHTYRSSTDHFHHRHRHSQTVFLQNSDLFSHFVVVETCRLLYPMGFTVVAAHFHRPAAWTMFILGTFIPPEGLVVRLHLPRINRGMIYLGACLIAGIRLARERQVNVRVVPTRQAIEESVDLAHEVYNQVFRKVPEKVKEVR